MLIEFQTFMMPEGFENELFKLKMHGITPIIAHPERYKQVQNNISIIEKLINSGCLMQIDGGSLIGHFGPKCKDSAEKMLKHNMVHIIGSDSHGMGKRNFCLKEVKNIAIKIANCDINDLVFSNPHKVINGQKIKPYEVLSHEQNTSIFHIIKNKFK